MNVRANNAQAKTVRAHLMIRLLEPNFATCPINKLVVAKQKTGIPARSAISAVLKLKRSLRIGINGLINTRPARMFRDAKKMGTPVRNLLFKIDPSRLFRG